MDENTYVEPQVVKKSNNTKAIVGFVCGIAGFLCCFPIGIVGLIFSIIALKEMRETGEDQGKGLAIAGLILAILGILWQVIVGIAYGAILVTFMNNPDAFYNYY